VAADGGTQAPIEGSPFETVSEVELSRKEQWYRFYDEQIRAPFLIMWEDWRARFGLLTLLFYALMGTVGVYIVEVPTPNQASRLVPAFHNWNVPLGTDRMGQDLLGLMVHATPAMAKMILAGAVFSMFIGVTIGTLAGYKGGQFDRVLMSLTDVVLTIPGLPLIIILGFALQPRDPIIIGLILGIDNWPALSRNLRSQVLSLREESYVEAERIIGHSAPRIASREITPQMMPYVSIHFMGACRRIIFESVGLYFLGVLPFSNLNWGVVLNQAYSAGGILYNLDMVHWLLVPMITITWLSLGLVLFSQGLDRVFNPRIRTRHTKTGTEGASTSTSK